MPFFMGEYTYAMDDKGRVKIPLAFKSDLAPEAGAIVYLVRDNDECVAVYTPAEYQKLKDRLTVLDREDPASRVKIRRQISCAFEVEVDAQGRIKVPTDLIKHARLPKGGEVKLAGFIDYIQIWNTDEYQKSMALQARSEA
jgi:MraZ protein